MAPQRISATQAKLRFGAMMKRVKKGKPIIVENNKTKDPSDAMVWISLEDYEDFLEVNNPRLQKEIEEGYQEIKVGKFGTLDDLYAIHRKTIQKRARS